jgi:hypothetical protein
MRCGAIHERYAECAVCSDSSDLKIGTRRGMFVGRPAVRDMRDGGKVSPALAVVASKVS